MRGVLLFCLFALFMILLTAGEPLSGGAGPPFEDIAFLGWNQEKEGFAYLHHYYICPGDAFCEKEDAGSRIALLVIKGERGGKEVFRWDSYEEVIPEDGRLRRIWNGALPKGEGEPFFREGSFYYYQEGGDYYHPEYGSAALFLKGEHLFQAEYLRREKVMLLRESERWRGNTLSSTLFFLNRDGKRKLMEFKSREEGVRIEYRLKFYFSLKGDRVVISVRRLKPAGRPSRVSAEVREFRF